MHKKEVYVMEFLMSERGGKQRQHCQEATSQTTERIRENKTA
jgi:hypothetical protein